MITVHSIDNQYNLSSALSAKETSLLSQFDIFSEINEYKAQIEDKFEAKYLASDCTIFKASDGKNYNLKSVLMERLYNVQAKINLKHEEEQKQNWFKRAIMWCKEKLNIGENYKKIHQQVSNDFSFLEKSSDVKTLFEKLTDKEYTQNNVEKFLKAEMKLLAEISCEKYIDCKLTVQDFAIPVFDKNWNIQQNKLDKEVSLSKSEQKKYQNLKDVLDEEYKHKLDVALKSGKLLMKNSNDNSNVLENLYKILNSPRIEGVSGLNVLEECLDILENPCVITQRAEDIPNEYQEKVLKNLLGDTKDREKIKEAKEKMEYRSLSTCAAASIEYSMAVKNSAEFFRLVNELTSNTHNARKNIKINEENKYIINQLDLFKLPSERTKDGVVITLNVGKNTELLAQIQNQYKDYGERSIIDIVIQSMIMHLGSRQTYDALRDDRAPNEFNHDTSGLVESEISFADNILNDKQTQTNNYMRIEQNGKFSQTNSIQKQKDLYKAILEDKNCIAGYVFRTPKTKQICGGHEVVIMGYTTNIAGNGFFVCQDSDDEFAAPVCISESYLLENLHHIKM